MLAHDGAIATDEHDEQQERWGQEPVENRAEKEHPHRVRPGEVQQHPRDHGPGEDQIEPPPAPRREIEPRAPAEDLGDGERRRSGQHRYGQEPRADDPQREEAVREVAGQGTQGLGGLARGLDLGPSGRMQGRGRREHDEEHRDVREQHAGEDGEPRVGQLVRRCAATLGQRPPALRLFLLHLVRGLPEKEIGRDRRPEHADERRNVRGVPDEARREGGDGDLPPVGLGQERRQNVRQEHRGQPLEVLGEARVVQVHGGQENARPEDGDRQQRRHAGEHPGRVRHAREIRRDVEDVGDQQQQTGAVEKRTRIVPANRAGEATTGHEADPRADELHGRHQRKRGRRRPEHPEAERGAGHGVGRDAARIVVRRAGDEPGPEEPEVADEGIVAVAIGCLSFGHEGSTIMPAPGVQGSANMPSMTRTTP